MGDFSIVVRNLRAVFSFMENVVSPSFMRGLMFWARAMEKVLHGQRVSHKTSRVLRLEKVLVEIPACLCKMPLARSPCLF